MELKELGLSFKSISNQLGISPKRVSSIAHGDSKLPTSIYEKTRTLHRTNISQTLSKQGFHGAFRKANERKGFTDIQPIVDKLDTIVEKTYTKWNESYTSYKKNPPEWKQKHQYRYFKGKNDKRKRWHYPKETKKSIIRTRVSKGASRVHDLELIESPKGYFISPVVEEVDSENAEY
jgi:transcriptional regulator with XRE-family HTH domain